MLLSRLALLTGLMAATVAASVPAVRSLRPRLEVHATATPPKIDGILDDPAWRDAAHGDAFRQVSPVENAPPTERTEVWVTFDADNLYVAIRCHDSAGLAGIRAYSMQRDQDNGSDDLVRVVFDSFNRQNDGYYFGLTAAGGMHDGLIQNKEDTNDRWDAIWYGKVTRDAGGWSAEFAIPVKSIAFDPANTTWGFNVSRTVRRKQEVMRWSGFVRAKGVTALPELGELHGLTGLRQGLGLDVKPYASLTHWTAPAAGEAGTEFNPGLDLVWHATPSLAATLTVNTDFADAEVDDRQVNLGRFSLFFPEKRGFFTQDAPLFSFAGIGRIRFRFFPAASAWRTTARGWTCWAAPSSPAAPARGPSDCSTWRLTRMRTSRRKIFSWAGSPGRCSPSPARASSSRMAIRAAQATIRSWALISTT